MEELKEMYDLMIGKLKNEHDVWVKSYEKINALSDGLRKLGYKDGDISSDPSINVLEEARSKEININRELTTTLFARKKVVREFEADAERFGLALKGTYEIFKD